MTITCENQGDIVVFTAEKNLSFSISDQYIFMARCVCWLAFIRWLEQATKVHIDNVWSGAGYSIFTAEQD
jgi:hypothetical protein